MNKTPTCIVSGCGRALWGWLLNEPICEKHMQVYWDLKRPLVEQAKRDALAILKAENLAALEEQ